MAIDPDYISKKQLAELLGVATVAVTRAVNAGRITAPEKMGEYNNRYRFRKWQALEEWANNTAPAVGESKGNGREAAVKLLAVRDQAHARAESLAAGELPDDETELDYTTARTRHEAAKAKLAEITLAQKRGELIEVEQAAAVVMDVFRVARDAFQNIPARLSGQLASLTDVDDVHDALDAALEQVLNDLAAEVARRYGNNAAS